MQGKSQARKKGNREKYKQLKKEIRAKIRRDKVTWLKEECEKITEANQEGKSKLLFQQIKKIKKAPDEAVSRSISMNDKSGNTLTEMNDILKR